jgi:signal transduction protein with GAF and PtsI domain
MIFLKMADLVGDWGRPYGRDDGVFPAIAARGEPIQKAYTCTRPISVCGEMAVYPMLLGINALGMAAPCIPRVK